MRFPARLLAILVTLLLLAGCALPGGFGGTGKGDFKLGIILPYSGVFAPLGDSMTKAMELYFESVNYTVAGRKIVLIKEDEGTPQDAVNKFRKLVDQDKVDMVAGVVSSGSLAQLVNPIKEAKVPTVIANAGFDRATRDLKSPYLFRTSFTNWQIAASQGQFAAEKLGKRAVTLQPDYQAGKDNVKAFKETYEKAGGKVVEEIYTSPPPPEGVKDFSPYFAKLKQSMANADMVYAFYAGAEAVRMVKQWKEYGLTGTRIIANGFMIGEDILPQVEGAANGMYGALGYVSTIDNAENKKFVADFQKKTGKVPDVYAAQAYETAIFIARALEAVKGDTKDQQKLLTAMKGITFNGPRGKFQLDPETQNIILTMYIFQVENGKPKVVHTIPNFKDPGK